MAKSISVIKARENLRISAKQVSSDSKTLSLSQAKLKLRVLDDELDLPPVVPYIDKGRWKDTAILSATWSISEAGVKMIAPLLRRVLTFKILG